MIDLDDVQLGTGGGSYSETKKLGILGSTFQAEGAKGSRMTFYGLADSTILGVELHGTDHTSLLGRNADYHHPLAITVNPVVDDLAALRRDD
jgi:hypothetical protein